ncbi:MAG: hypothetical protein K0Q65_1948, partial [Clostridia bacterium]|nr:hypothetical protein [Clostridia bacterium]
MTEATELIHKSAGKRIRNIGAPVGVSILYLILALIQVYIEIKSSLLQNGLSIINKNSIFIGVAGVIYSMYICYTLKLV